MDQPHPRGNQGITGGVLTRVGQFNFWQWYDRASQELKIYGVPSLELDWLIDQVLGIDKLQLRLQRCSVPPEAEIIVDLWQKRLHDRVPVQYLAQKVGWRNLSLVVNPAVLIPRPETELLIDLIPNLALPVGHDRGIWVDMGTGSGSIAIALSLLFPHAQVYGTDISKEALEIAKLNAQRQNAQIIYRQGHWFEAIPDLQGQVTGIISNPPYIPTADLGELSVEVSHEPPLALDGGADGLTAIKELIQSASAYLLSGGVLGMELGLGQAGTVTELLAQQKKYTSIHTYKDYGGVDRFVIAIRK
jgi:release factor glutamine methyltransferase